MFELSEQVAVQVQPRRLDVPFPRGFCSLAVTTNPFALPAELNMWAYAVLADWITENPVAMWMTFRNRIDEDDPNRRLVREVYSVDAAPELRGVHTPGEMTIPVAIGTWLFDTGGLTDHSPDRTDAGERWAQKVGGLVHPRQQKGTADDAEQQGPAVLQLMNQAGLRPA